MRQFSDWQIVNALLIGATQTIYLSLIAFGGGAVVGAMLTMLRLVRFAWLRSGLAAFVTLMQAVPLLMLFFMTFFGPPLFGIDVNAWTAAAIALTIFGGVYFADIWTSAVDAVPKGQWEAARSLGLRFLPTLLKVIAPQALRVAIPPTVGFSVQLVKGTALASIIGFLELTKTGTMLNNVTFRPFFVFTLVGLIYFVLCFPISFASRRLERRFGKMSLR